MPESISWTFVLIDEKTPEGYVLKWQLTGGTTPPTTASTYAVGCEITNTVTGVVYRNGGTVASPSWQNTDEISTSEIADLAVTAGKLAATLDLTGKTVTLPANVLNAGKIDLFKSGSAAVSASGILFWVGTTANPAASATASVIFGEVRSKASATSGTSQGLYWRHEISGAGGSGNGIAVRAKVTAAGATARWAHFALDLDTAGSVSGFGAGIDAQLMLGGAAYDDDITAQNLEIYANAGATVTGRTSFIRPVIQGDSTAVANVNANAFFIDLSNVTASATGLIDTDITALTGYGALRVRCPDGVTRYIPITTGS